MNTSKRALIWSYGGGTQSIALACLLVQGRVPRPERIVIADTGKEAALTWEYTDAHVRPLLARIGLTIETAAHDLATVDLYGHNGDLLIPAFTAGGKLPTFCSNEWKARVVRRWLLAAGYGPKHPVTMWLGMSLDEVGRLKPGPLAWQIYAWPLVFDVPLTRADCRELVLSMGLPLPIKSRCWGCPHQGNAEWQELKTGYPADWRAAVVLDQAIRAADRTQGVYLHKSRVPLADADLSQPDAPPLPLFGDVDGCDSGFCMV